jgi:helix-turn-helix protein
MVIRKHDYEMSNANFEMFVMFPFWIMYTDLKPETRCVYLALWSHKRPDKNAVYYPSVNRIAWLANISRSRAFYGLRELESAGLVTIEERGEGRTNLYTLHEPSREQIEALVDRRNGKALTSQNGKSDVVTSSSHDTATPSHHVATTSHHVATPSHHVATPQPPRGYELDIRTRTKDQNQEPEPGKPDPAGATAFGGGSTPSQEDIPGSDGKDQDPLGPAPVSSSNDLPPTAVTDFAELRSRLERHSVTLPRPNQLRSPPR